jgi:hypothetical protein
MDIGSLLMRLFEWKKTALDVNYEHSIKTNSDSPDTKRQAYTVAVKLARVAHSIVKNNVDYHGYFEVFRGT